MDLRGLLGLLPVAALALCAWTSCKGAETQGSAAVLEPRCEQIGKTCGDTDKHDEKIIEECATSETSGTKTRAPAAAESSSIVTDWVVGAIALRLIASHTEVWSQRAR